MTLSLIMSVMFGPYSTGFFFFFLLFLFLFFGHTERHVPLQGSKAHPFYWKYGVLTARLSGKSAMF